MIFYLLVLYGTTLCSKKKRTFKTRIRNNKLTCGEKDFEDFYSSKLEKIYKYKRGDQGRKYEDQHKKNEDNHLFPFRHEAHFNTNNDVEDRSTLISHLLCHEVFDEEKIKEYSNCSTQEECASYASSGIKDRNQDCFHCDRLNNDQCNVLRPIYDYSHIQ